MPLLLASARSDLYETLAALLIGLAIGILGHLTRSRTLVLIGILMIALASAYFSFVLKPGSG